MNKKQSVSKVTIGISLLIGVLFVGNVSVINAQESANNLTENGNIPTVNVKESSLVAGILSSIKSFFSPSPAPAPTPSPSPAPAPTPTPSSSVIGAIVNKIAGKKDEIVEKIKSVFSNSPLSNNNSSSSSSTAFNYNLSNSGNVSVTKPVSGNVDVSNTISATLASGVSPASAQSVSFTLRSLPSGVSASKNNASCVPNCSGDLTLTISPSATIGVHNITVTGKSNNLPDKITSFNLTINQTGKYDLTVSRSPASDGSGSITISSDNSGEITCKFNKSNASSCGGNYSKGENITIKVNPDSDSKFFGWGGSCGGSGTNIKCDVANLSSNKTTSVTFVKK